MYYLKGVIGLPIVISFRDRGYIHIFFLEMGSLMTSSSLAGPIQISKFPEPCSGPCHVQVNKHVDVLHLKLYIEKDREIKIENKR